MDNASAERKAGCLVTGCAGFLGSHLTEALLGLGHRVVGVDSLFAGNWSNMVAFSAHPNFTFLKTSVTLPRLYAEAQRLVPELGHVFHLAAIVSQSYATKRPMETMAVNCIASLGLFEEARRLGAFSFVFAGSMAEHGDVEDSREPGAVSDAAAATPASPANLSRGLSRLHNSPYGRSKYLVSRHISDAGFGVSLRFCPVYGPRQDPASPYTGLVSQAMTQALHDEIVEVPDDGRLRDFLHVRDAVRACLMAAGLHEPGAAPATGLYDVGSDAPVDTVTLARLVLRGAGQPEDDVDVVAGLDGGLALRVVSGESFRQAVGFSPAVHLEEGVRQSIAWLRDHDPLGLVRPLVTPKTS